MSLTLRSDAQETAKRPVLFSSGEATAMEDDRTELRSDLATLQQENEELRTYLDNVLAMLEQQQAAESEPTPQRRTEDVTEPTTDSVLREHLLALERAAEQEAAASAARLQAEQAAVAAEQTMPSDPIVTNPAAAPTGEVLNSQVQELRVRLERAESSIEDLVMLLTLNLSKPQI